MQILWGAFCFGLVIGWVTYRTLRRTTSTAISDIAAVIGALGGAAVLKLFPAESTAFDSYSIGLASGFFFYLITATIVAHWSGDRGSTLEWMGESRGGQFLGNR